MSDIFISYFHKDRPAAEAFARAFETLGWSVWWDRAIPAGKNFDSVIEEALTGAKVVMVLWSHESVQSRWVRNEAEEAAARNILVPVLIESDVPIPLAFKRIQAADLVGWNGEPQAVAFQSLVADMAQRIGPVVVPTPSAFVRPPEPPLPTLPPQPPRHRFSLLQTRVGLTSLLAAVFVVNYIETLAETLLRRHYNVGSELGDRIAFAFRGLERNLTFESHDVTNWLAVYGYSIAYFFLLPVLGVSLMVALWRRADLHGYRLLCLGIAFDYVLSLGFFVFFPVPERWAYPDSGAILLSDRWSSNLIEALRPISGLDNCFPSSHVSLTVVVILVGYACRVRFRHTALALGAAVILSTFVLGIHWIPDILAGVAVGVLSVTCARYLSHASSSLLAPRRIRTSHCLSQLLEIHG